MHESSLLYEHMSWDQKAETNLAEKEFSPEWIRTLVIGFSFDLNSSNSKLIEFHSILLDPELTTNTGAQEPWIQGFVIYLIIYHLSTLFVHAQRRVVICISLLHM